MSATVDQIAHDGDCAAVLHAMAEVYRRYGSEAVDVPAARVPTPRAPAQPLPGHEAPVEASS